MKTPSMRKDLYKERLGSLPSTDIWDAYSPAALVDGQKTLSQMLVTFNAAPKPYSKETDLRTPSCCGELY